jgi:SWI/SNF-related matrix-associated actin-dependent regulator of chromatin subfamily A3
MNTYSSSQIYRAACKLTGKMEEAAAKLRFIRRHSKTGYSFFGLTKSVDELVVSFQDGTTFADVNAHLVTVLGPLVDNQKLQFEAVADIDSLQELIDRSVKANDAVGRFNINIYGPESLCQEVGDALSTKRVYLQRPDHQRPGTVYNNPHFLKVPDIQLLPQELIPVQNSARKTTTTDKGDDFRKTIANVYSGLKRGKGLNRVKRDRRIITPLLA